MHEPTTGLHTGTSDVLSWTKCFKIGCNTMCPGKYCEEHEDANCGILGEFDIEKPQTTPDLSIIDDPLDDETEITAVLHRVDDLRIVRVDGLVSTYRIEERRDGIWETQAELTREQVLLVAGMVNNRWTDG